MLSQEVGDVQRDGDIQTVHDRQYQLGPVIGARMASEVHLREGRKAVVRVGFEAQRTVPQVVAATLIQKDHLQTIKIR